MQMEKAFLTTVSSEPLAKFLFPVPVTSDTGAQKVLWPKGVLYKRHKNDSVELEITSAS
jgi:hypothetical protein